MTMLLLAGTSEARAFATLLAESGITSIASLAGVTDEPLPYPIPTRTGGFGGVAGLMSYLGSAGISAVVDATHPFAEQMQAHAAKACKGAGVPRLRLLRPAWPPRPGWQQHVSIADAARALPKGARVFATTGRGGIDAFAAREDCAFVVRTIEPLGELPRNVSSVQARAPFDTQAERNLMIAQRITHLLTKNSGGPTTGKLDAADTLGLPTLVIKRPKPPKGTSASTPAEALAWLQNTGLVANQTR